MSVIAFSLLAALAAIVSVVLILGSQVYFNRERRRRFESLELVPNILMTRYPLMFVGRARSMFRLSGDFLELPAYLQEHGFQVEEIELYDDRTTPQSLRRLLATAPSRVHLIVSDALADVGYDLALEGHAKVATLTILGQRGLPLTLRPTPLPVFEKPELRPSLIADTFQTEEIALEHMVSLAEYDLR